MKTLLIYCSIILMATACVNSKKEIKEKEAVKQVVISDSEKTEKLFGKFKSLYIELLSFKDKSDFRKYGFGEGGNYNRWLKDIKVLKNNPDSKLLLKKGVVAGELEQLGLEYVKSKGKETETTRFFNKTFTEALNPKKVEKVEVKSGNSNYDNLKQNYKLLGRWKITNTIVKESYPYEIYFNNNEYIGVIPQGKYKTEILIKKGLNYSVKGNKDGEYYKIDSNKNMSLYDKDGELASMGYKAVRLK